jgi:hypothetical protein
LLGQWYATASDADQHETFGSAMSLHDFARDSAKASRHSFVIDEHTHRKAS